MSTSELEGLVPLEISVPFEPLVISSFAIVRRRSKLGATSEDVEGISPRDAVRDLDSCGFDLLVEVGEEWWRGDEDEVL